MKTFCCLQAILLSTAFAAFVRSGQTTNESSPTQSPAAQSSPSAGETDQNDQPVVDPARLAERERLGKQAKQLYTEGKVAEATAKYSEIVELERGLLGKDHEVVVASLQQLAKLHEQVGDFAAAKKALQEVLETQTKQLGKNHWQVADARWALNNIDLQAELTPEQVRRMADANGANQKMAEFQRQAQFTRAIPLAAKALDTSREILGENHPATARCLNNLAGLYQSQGDFAKALPLYEKALEIYKQALGENHPVTASSLNNLAGLYQARGEYGRALPLFKQALAATEQALGENHPNTATSLNNLATLYESQGDFARALPLYKQALALNKLTLVDNHPNTATSLSNLARLYTYQGDFAAALSLYEQAMAIRKQALGENHPDYAVSLNELARLYKYQGDYARALSLDEQALTITKQALGENHLDTAASLDELAGVYESHGDYARALPLYEQALVIRKKALGENHSVTAESLNNLANLYESMADYARALPLYEQALVIRKKALGENHPVTAISLNNLAVLYETQGDYARALPLLEQVLVIYTRLLGENHPVTATSLNNLAALRKSQGDYAQALQLFQQALAIRKLALGENHPETAESLNNLGAIYCLQGDYSRSLPLYEKGLAIHKKALGENHPGTAKSLSNLAYLYHAQGDHAQALPLFELAGEIMIGHLDTTSSIQSERQQLAHSNELKGFIDNFVSCSLMASRLENNAYEQVIARKGAVLRRQRQLQLVRDADDPKEARLWNDLQSVATRLATISFRTPQPDQAATWRQQLADLTEQKERLEAKLSQRSTEFRQLQSQVRLSPDELRAILPEEVALVDLLEFSRLVVKKQPAGPPKGHSERRLVAFVVRADSQVVAVDLGLAEPIDVAVAAWRGSLFDETKSVEQGDAGQTLRRLIWQPLASHLQGAKTVLISPDGALAGIPWGALPGSEPSTYLLEELTIAVVPVPQLIPEMLRETEDDVEPSLLVVGDVDYGAVPGQPVLVAQSRSAPRSESQRDGQSGKWPALAASRPEIADIEASFRQAFPPAEVAALRAADATEEAFRQQAGKHRFLHLATHGFFSPPEVRSALAPDKSRDPSLGHSDLFGERGVVGFHPGLLSGIVLAGANLPLEPERDDGILTALEVGALDLRNVDLVTLSACETGLGEVAGGEGILGLQRAFQIAGARTTVTSLWKVSDDATRALMSEFYKNLWEKKLPRIEALRQAQLAMLNGYDPDSGALRGPGENVDIDPDTLVASQDNRTPPRYWAAFVLSGDWQ